MTLDYKAAGVDIDAANQAKQLMASAVRSTHTAAVL
ncbi:MAG: phosphoribosylformylglycinamidine cyclo-ligase, partial [Chloroflexota bacterium]|nr:phosphoribosylformylglycinamidine cyclo-ligase [Chloroflexota bacterium]